jgi:hypothetical protein
LNIFSDLLFFCWFCCLQGQMQPVWQYLQFVLQDPMGKTGLALESLLLPDLYQLLLRQLFRALYRVCFLFWICCELVLFKWMCSHHWLK